MVEEAVLEVMYDIPERADVRKCIITEETIRSGRLPLLLTKSEVDKGVDETNYEEWLPARPPAHSTASTRLNSMPCPPGEQSRGTKCHVAFGPDGATMHGPRVRGLDTR